MMEFLIQDVNDGKVFDITELVGGVNGKPVLIFSRENLSLI